MFKLRSFLKETYTTFICSQLIIITFFSIFYLDNFYQITFNEFAISIIELIILFLLIHSIIGVINKKILFFLPFGIVLIFQYWNIYEQFNEFSKEILLIIIFILWFLISIFLWRKGINELKNINLIFASIIILGHVFEISSKFSNTQNLNEINPKFIEKKHDAHDIKIIDKNELPNVVYIIPDRYLGLNQLRDYYDFDNTDFYNQLRKRNFIIPNESRSNYPFTYASLLSTLNNSYLINNNHNLRQGASYPLIKESYVFKKVKQMGYEFINFDNWWKGSQNIDIADFNYYRNESYISTTTYDFIYFRTPILAIFDKIFPSKGHRFSCSNVKNKFDDLSSAIDSNDSGLFIFAHFLVPHRPYLINANGDCKNSGFGATPKNTKENYIGYLEYTNKKLLEIFDKISSKSNNLIFVIQSDEGQYPECFEEFINCDLNDWDLKTGTINAFYYSKEHALNEKDFTTPINNFSNIFDIIENKSSNKENHKIFIPKNKLNDFNFKEIKID